MYSLNKKVKPIHKNKNNCIDICVFENFKCIDS